MYSLRDTGSLSAFESTHLYRMIFFETEGKLILTCLNGFRDQAALRTAPSLASRWCEVHVTPEQILRIHRWLTSTNDIPALQGYSLWSSLKVSTSRELELPSEAVLYLGHVTDCLTAERAQSLTVMQLLAQYGKTTDQSQREARPDHLPWDHVTPLKEESSCGSHLDSLYEQLVHTGEAMIWAFGPCARRAGTKKHTLYVKPMFVCNKHRQTHFNPDTWNRKKQDRTGLWLY